MQNQSREITLSLLKNSEDFAEEAIRNAIEAEKAPKRWKFAILHLVQATELCLKGVLEQEHRSLIFVDVDKPNRTVTPMQAFDRVRKWAQKDFSDKDRKTLEKSIDFRNEVIHGEVRFNSDQMKARFTKLVGFLQELIHDCFKGEHLSDSIKHEVWENFLKIEAYVSELRNRGRRELESIGEDRRVGEGVTCPACGSEMLYYPDPRNCDVRCCCCGFSDQMFSCDRCGKHLFETSFDHIDKFGKVYCEDCDIYLSDHGDYLCHIIKDGGRP